MKKQKVHAYRFEASSLLRLRMVLTHARKSLAPRVAKKDANEELALRLIRNMKREQKKHLPFMS